MVMTDFSLTYDEVILSIPGIPPLCGGCEEVFSVGELAAHIKMGGMYFKLHRECADQLAVLLRQFIIATTPEDEDNRIN
jgi:hypothetical protein